MLSKTWGEKAFDVFNLLILLLFGFMTLYPFLYVLTLSLSTPVDARLPGLHLIPWNPTVSSYVKVFANPQIYTAYGNTILRTVLGTALSVGFCALTAYPLSRKGFPHRNLAMKLFVFSMMFNGGVIPMYLLIKNLGLINNIGALVLPGAVTAFNVIVLKNFFQGIPAELNESAKIDGANDIVIFRKVVLPLSMPVLAVIALWAGVGHWNAWFDALIYMQDTNKQVVQLFLRKVVLEQSESLATNQELMKVTQYTSETLKAAMIMVVTLPILLVYPFIQRFFVQGITLGSVKG